MAKAKQPPTAHKNNAYDQNKQKHQQRPGVIQGVPSMIKDCNKQMGRGAMAQAD
jgi:hypothetical protein